MCSLHPNTNNSEVAQNKDQDDEENPAALVTSHLYLKPPHATGTLDKAVVLRRIRHRKRVNKVKSAVQALLSSPFASNAADDKKTSVARIRWADDAFAAP
ncbi:UNVERIFIED_CONTAM: hypothetical protein Sradi_3505200 [Sesamum radiatum]|uniref:Uncharacterized protein n=1 Tax=Sesamum radiatum TaxID=300843 RepID=A0AAW2QEX9_SESRA